MDLSPQHVQVRHSEQIRDEKKPLQTFRRLLTKLLIWKMTKREAFWHVDVKNTRLCKSVLPCFSRLKSVQGAEDSSGIISISEVRLYPGVQPPFCMPGDIDTGSNLALERTPSVTSDCSQISGSSKAFMTDGELPSNKKKLGCKQQATGNGDDNVDVTIVFLNLPQLENPPFASWCFLWCAFFGWDLNSSKCARKYWRSCKENNPAATVTFAESSCVRQVKIWARNQGYGTGAGIQAMVLRGSDLGLFRKIRTGVFWCFFEFLHWRSWTHHELMMLMGFEWIWCF